VLSLALVGSLLACAPTAAPTGSAARSGAPSGAAPSAPGTGAAGSSATAATAAQAGAAAATTVSPALQAVIDGARKEGSLSFIWGEGTFGGTDGVREIAAGLNARYGLNLDVRFTPGPAMPTVAARVLEEYQAGRPASTDLVVGYANHMYTLMQGGALAAVDWASWAPDVQEPRLLAADGGAVTFESSVQGITYNSSRVAPADVPRSMEDLLKPQYKNRLASTPYASGFDRLATPEMWGEARTLEYTAKLADQVAGLIRCNEKDRLLSGEFDLFALDCSHNDAFAMRARGLPIDFQTASDAPFILLLYMGVPKNAPHPNAARLWVDYVLSREGQDTLDAREFSDSHLLPGSKMAPIVAKMQEGDGKLLIVDVNFYQTHDEALLTRTLTQIQRIIQKQ
jgi:iron(III) transport system substrate-binding protein